MRIVFDLERVPGRGHSRRLLSELVADLVAALDRAREPRTLRLLERGQHRVDQERRAPTEQADHELAEGFTEARVGAIGGFEQTPGVAALGAGIGRAQDLERGRERRTERAHADRLERGRIFAQIDVACAIRAQEPRARHLGVVVILGGDPERRHRFASRPLQTLGDQRGAGHLGQGVERTAEESRLLAGHDDQRVGIGEALRQLARARVAVRRVGALELGRDLGALTRPRLERGQLPRRGENERRQQLVAAARDEVGGQPREEAIAAQMEWRGAGGRRGHVRGVLMKARSRRILASHRAAARYAPRMFSTMRAAL